MSSLLSSIKSLTESVRRLQDLARRQAEDLKAWKDAYEHVSAQLLDKEDEIARLAEPSRAAKRQRLQ